MGSSDRGGQLAAAGRRAAGGAVRRRGARRRRRARRRGGRLPPPRPRRLPEAGQSISEGAGGPSLTHTPSGLSDPDGSESDSCRSGSESAACDPDPAPIHTSFTAVHTIHAQPSPAFKVGDRVRCRHAGEEWRLGTVTDVDGPKVCPDGLDDADKWDEVEPARPESDSDPSGSVPSGSESDPRLGHGRRRHGQQRVDVQRGVRQSGANPRIHHGGAPRIHHGRALSFRPG
eukprot:gene18063-biopygen3435